MAYAVRCPKCQNYDLQRHSGCATPILLVLGCVIAIVLSSQIREPAVALIPGLISVFLFAASIAAAWSSLFGKNKCKKCGHRWRGETAAAATVPEQLQTLAQLRTQGTLSEEDYEAAKRRVLGSNSTGSERISGGPGSEPSPPANATQPTSSTTRSTHGTGKCVSCTHYYRLTGLFDRFACRLTGVRISDPMSESCNDWRART